MLVMHFFEEQNFDRKPVAIVSVPTGPQAASEDGI